MSNESYSRESFEKGEKELQEVSDAIRGDKGVKELRGLIDKKELLENARIEMTNVAHEEALREDLMIEDKDLNKKFTEVLQGKYHYIPEGLVVESDLPGVKEIYIAQPKNIDAKSTFITLYYDTFTKRSGVVEHSFSIPIARPGYNLEELTAQQIPRELGHLKYDEVLNEVLEDLKAINMDKWKPLDAVIVAPEELDSVGPGRAEGVYSRASLDRERISFFMKQRELLQALYPKQSARISYGRGYGPGRDLGGLSEYHAFLYPYGAIFENPIEENATYFYKFDKPLTKVEIDTIKTGRIANDEFINLLKNRNFFEQIGEKKSALRSRGQRWYRQHPPQDASPEIKNKYYSEMQNFLDNHMSTETH